MLIIFEGIDGCGKTTLSKKFSEQKNFVWTKEPTFSSQEADSLNLKSQDTASREVIFLIDRIRHQRILWQYKNLNGILSSNAVCDRYIWSGLAYCKVFNPSCFDFIKHLYDHDYFVKPDFYVFVDTPIELCLERCAREQTPEQLKTLREAYLDTQHLVAKHSSIINFPAIEPVEVLVEELWSKVLGLEKNSLTTL
jgi:thymidylate kinase